MSKERSMMKTEIFRKWQFLGASFLLFALLSGCSTPEKKGTTAAELLYKDAQGNVESERYILATEKLNTIKSQYPYSFYAIKAELLLADILFLQENYIESAAAYILFKELHPKYEKTKYVVWRIAESYYNQLPDTHDRDLSPAHESLKYYREVLREFEGDEYKNEAQDKIQKIEDMLLARDLDIAHYYFKTKSYEAARFRYLNVLSYLPDQKKEKSVVARKIVESSFLAGKFKDCLRYSEDLKSFFSDTAEEVAKITKKCEQKLNIKK
jgi:outer membrane protein assembly factor BamD